MSPLTAQHFSGIATGHVTDKANPFLRLPNLLKCRHRLDTVFRRVASFAQAHPNNRQRFYD